MSDTHDKAVQIKVVADEGYEDVQASAEHGRPDGASHLEDAAGEKEE